MLFPLRLSVVLMVASLGTLASAQARPQVSHFAECFRFHLDRFVQSAKGNTLIVNAKDIEAAKIKIAPLLEDRSLKLDDLKTPSEKLAFIELSQPEHWMLGNGSETLDHLSTFTQLKVTRALTKLNLSRLGSPGAGVAELRDIFLALHPPSELPPRLRMLMQKGMSARELVEAQVTSELSHRNLNDALVDLGIIQKNGSIWNSILGWNKANADIRLGLAQMGLETIALTHGIPMRMPLPMVPEFSMLSRRIRALSTEDLQKITDENFDLSPDKTAQALGIARSAKNTVWTDGATSSLNRGIMLYLIGDGIFIGYKLHEARKTLEKETKRNEQKDPAATPLSDTMREVYPQKTMPDSASLDQLIRDGINEAIVTRLDGTPVDPNSIEARESLIGIIEAKKAMLHDTTPVDELEISQAKKEYAEMLKQAGARPQR